METQTLEEVLAHYGVPGMKWGVRRSNKQLAKAAKKQAKKDKKEGKNASEDAKKAKAAADKVKKEGVKSLSNKELQQLNTRLNLEKQYSQLSSSEKSAGSKFAQELLINVGKQQATKLANDQISKTLRTKGK